jgi:hypothetical protein
VAARIAALGLTGAGGPPRQCVHPGGTIVQVAIPRPSRHGPSRSGAVSRLRQPKSAAAVSYACRSFFDDQGRPLSGSVSAWLRSRSSSGSTPAAWASSFIAPSTAHSPTPSIGARIGVGWIVSFAAPADCPS